jgi:hypothetical protein
MEKNIPLEMKGLNIFSPVGCDIAPGILRL